MSKFRIEYIGFKLPSEYRVYRLSPIERGVLRHVIIKNGSLMFDSGMELLKFFTDYDTTTTAGNKEKIRETKGKVTLVIPEYLSVDIPVNTLIVNYPGVRPYTSMIVVDGDYELDCSEWMYAQTWRVYPYLNGKIHSPDNSGGEVVAEVAAQRLEEVFDYSPTLSMVGVGEGNRSKWFIRNEPAELTVLELLGNDL